MASSAIRAVAKACSDAGVGPHVVPARQGGPSCHVALRPSNSTPRTAIDGTCAIIRAALPMRSSLVPLPSWPVVPSLCSGGAKPSGYIARAMQATAAVQHRHFAVLAHRWQKPHTAAAEPPRGVVVMLHGILGSKSNWGTPSKRLLRDVAPTGWHALLLDHRSHGQSAPGGSPHTLKSCAQDVLDTLREVGVGDEGGDKLVICGHSFGGKVALEVTRLLLARGMQPPLMTWTLDSPPGLWKVSSNHGSADTETAMRAVEAVQEQGPQPSRAALASVFEYEYGLPSALALWLAQSVRTTVDGRVELSYDMSVIRKIFEDAAAQDLWPVLEGGQARVGIVIAGLNPDVWPTNTSDRLSRCGNRVQSFTLEHAGHNVHVEDLPGLLAALAHTWS